MVSKDCNVHKHPGFLLHFKGEGCELMAGVTEYFVFTFGENNFYSWEPTPGFKVVAEEEVSLPGWVVFDTPLVVR